MISRRGFIGGAAALLGSVPGFKYLAGKTPNSKPPVPPIRTGADPRRAILLGGPAATEEMTVFGIPMSIALLVFQTATMVFEEHDWNARVDFGILRYNFWKERQDGALLYRVVIPDILS